MKNIVFAIVIMMSNIVSAQYPTKFVGEEKGDTVTLEMRDKVNEGYKIDYNGHVYMSVKSDKTNQSFPIPAQNLLLYGTLLFAAVYVVIVMSTTTERQETVFQSESRIRRDNFFIKFLQSIGAGNIEKAGQIDDQYNTDGRKDQYAVYRTEKGEQRIVYTEGYTPENNHGFPDEKK